MSTTTKLGRVQCLDGNRTYFALLNITADVKSPSMSVVLTDVGHKAWIGTLDSDFIAMYAQRAKCTKDEYVAMTVSCLIERSADCDPEQRSKLICQVKELDNGQAELTWKRQLVDDDDVSVRLGTITMSDSDLAEGLHAILTFGVTRIRELEKLTEEHHLRERESERDYRTILNKLDTLVTAKEQMERDLYAKFVAVLNEKKAEIRRLSSSSKTSIKKYNISEPTVGVFAASVGGESSSDPDDLSGDEEDDFQDCETPQLERRKRSKCVGPIDQDDDLLLDDDSATSQSKTSVAAPFLSRQPRNKVVTNVGTSASVAPKRSKVTTEVPKESEAFDSQDLLADM